MDPHLSAAENAKILSRPSDYPVYDFKYFQALPFGLFEFEDL